MKNLDILIVENKLTHSWDDHTLFLQVIPVSISKAKKIGAIKEHPILLKGFVWTDYLKLKSPKSFEYLQTKIKPALGSIPLENVHPSFFGFHIATIASIKAEKLLGMDNQIEKHFNLSNRTIFSLETIKDLQTIGLSVSLMELSKFYERPVDSGDIITAIDMLDKAVTLMETMSKKSPKATYENAKDAFKKLSDYLEMNPEKASEIIESQAKGITRTKMWIPRLLQYFKDYSNKSIVVVVGALHFPGNEGIMSLLAQHKFTFSHFGEGEVPAAVTKAFTGKYGAPPPKIPGKSTTKKTVAQLVDMSIEQYCKTKKWPQIIEPGQPERDCSSIRSELIGILVRARATKPSITPRATLFNYIQIRNMIYADQTINDKEKAHTILKQNPTFKIEQIKENILQ